MQRAVQLVGFPSATRLGRTHRQPSRREIVSINDRRLMCREKFKATTAQQERALQRPSRCQSTDEMRQSGILQRRSIRIVISEARCGSCVTHFSLAASVRSSATRTSSYTKLRHPAVQAGWEKDSRSRLETGTSSAICAMARAWRLQAGGHLKSDTFPRVFHRAEWNSSRRNGTSELIMCLAMRKVPEVPFEPTADHELKDLIKRELKHRRTQGDQTRRRPPRPPVDFRFVAPILEAAEDPELSLRDFARGVRVGPGAWPPRQPALYKPKRKWWRTSGRQGRTDSVRRGNNSSLFEIRTTSGCGEPGEQGHVLKCSEAQAKEKFASLTVALLGAIQHVLKFLFGIPCS